MTGKKCNYILKTVGITLPNYDRKDLKLGMAISLDEEIGDKFAKRGFLVKASEVQSKDDKELSALKKENVALKKELAALKK